MAMVLLANRKSSEYGGTSGELRLVGDALRGGLQSLLARAFRAAPGRHGVHPGAFIAGHLRARLPRGTLERGAAAAVSPGGRRPGAGPVVVSAPVADAGFLAVPDRVDGPRSHDGDVPGALHALPRAPRAGEAVGSKVWAFLGDGEMDEPESMGALTMPVREGLDNLIFVINCNLQRLDGPVRGNGKIIQELEAAFLGAGWNVIKVLWGSRWDPLLARDTRGSCAGDGAMRRRRVPELQGQGRRLHPRALLRQVPGAQGDGRQHVGRGDLAAEPRRSRSHARCTRPTRGRAPPGSADA